MICCCCCCCCKYPERCAAQLAAISQDLRWWPTTPDTVPINTILRNFFDIAKYTTFNLNTVQNCMHFPADVYYADTRCRQSRRGCWLNGHCVGIVLTTWTLDSGHVVDVVIDYVEKTMTTGFKGTIKRSKILGCVDTRILMPNIFAKTVQHGKLI